MQVYSFNKIISYLLYQLPTTINYLLYGGLHISLWDYPNYKNIMLTFVKSNQERHLKMIKKNYRYDHRIRVKVFQGTRRGLPPMAANEDSRES